MNHFNCDGKIAARLRETRRRLAIALLATVFAASITVTQASAASQPADFSFDFSSTAPNAPADAALHILYKDPENPDDPESKPPALTEVRIQAPPGTVFDGAAVPACSASDDQIMQQGRSACPAESIVGRGFGSVETTGPTSDPFVLDATLFNAGDAVIEVFTFQGTEVVAAVDRARFEAPNTMVLHPPVIPGITEREFAWTYYGTPETASTALRTTPSPFITTPPRCPASGEWKSRLDYTVTTGASYSVSDTTPCRRARIRVHLTPTKVRAGERNRIRVELSSSDANCISRAAVRLQGHRSVRTNRLGEATLVAEFGTPGRHRLTASKPSCRRGKAALSVLRTDP